MKSISRIGIYGASVGLAAFLAGCATEKITVDYVMPAKAVADVSKVNVAAIKVNAKVTGNLAGDNKRNAGLVKQLLAMRLYKEGFYQVTDDIWATLEGASAMEKAIAEMGGDLVAALPRDSAVQEAETLGKTVIEALPDSDMAGQYRALAKEILRRTIDGEEEEDDEEEASGGGRNEAMGRGGQM